MRARWAIGGALGVAVGVVALAVVAGPLRPVPPPSSLDAERQPSPSPSIAAATPIPMPSPGLHLDGLATVVPPGGVRLYRDPGGKRQKGPDATIAEGTTVFLDGERLDADGHAWWAVAPENTFLRYGWVPVADTHGVPALAPADAGCPTTRGPGVATVGGMGLYSRVVCFGDRELTFRGVVTCYQATVDGSVSGASWLANYSSCSLDDAIGLNSALFDANPGDALPARGRYEVTGHYDDAEARLCYPIPFGVSVSGPHEVPDPAAVVGCRALFVVTSMRPLE